ncbi:MAG: class II aldolase/adducin family protein [Ruminococcaceae bacterium]|nr:class II aldolase/adducin family protein [Oscillospiraceae bacterium]
MKFDKQAIRDVLTVAKRLDVKGVLSAYEGNISVLKDGLVYITPSGKNKAFLTEKDIAILDMNGNQVGGRYPASSEYKLHLHAYQVRPDVFGVVHAHPGYLTAFALCGKPVECDAYPEILAVYNKIEVAAYGRPGTDDIYAGVAPILEKENIFLLENHGAVTVGSTVFEAMNLIETAESSARIVALANQIGTPKYLPQEELNDLYAIHEKRMGR